MPFYIRKGLNFGPIRVNLSKSGMGLSAGVRGARLGINSKGGTYIHGGRHGLYYRKNLGKIGGTGHDKPITFNQEPTDFFTDTGLTYPIWNLQQEPLDIPPFPTHNLKPLLWIGLITILVAIITPNLEIKLLLAGSGVVLLALQQWEQNKTKKLIKLLEEIKYWSKRDQNKTEWKKSTAKVSQKLHMSLASHALYTWLYRQIEEDDLSPLEDIIDWLPVEKKWANDLAQYIYKEVIEEVLADHQITATEQSFIEELEENWKIPPSEIKSERKLIEGFQKLRALQEEKIPSTNFTRGLVRDETPYFEGEGRLLNQRVLDSWQENKVRYRQLGYVLDMEGLIRISNRVLEIEEGSNTRSYPLNQLNDIHLSLEEGVLEVFFRNRKNPVYLTSTYLFEIAGILARLIK
jgi:hypothetical protein